MADITLSILKPSVNNMTVRMFVRAAGLDFEEVDVWGHTMSEQFLAKDPAHLTPMLEEEGLPRGALWESCAIMQYLCNKHGLESFYPTEPGARATYPTLNFPQYAGEVGWSDADEISKAKAEKDAAVAIAEPLEVYNAFFL